MNERIKEILENVRQSSRGKGHRLNVENVPYDKIAIVGPIVIDFIQRSLLFGLEYYIYGHRIREAVRIYDGTKRIEQVTPQGKVIVGASYAEDFTRFWDKVSSTIMAELEALAKDRVLAHKREAERSRSGEAPPIEFVEVPPPEGEQSREREHELAKDPDRGEPSSEQREGGNQHEGNQVGEAS